jgi:thiol-disulfide isomerase/thioredoxin
MVGESVAGPVGEFVRKSTILFLCAGAAILALGIAAAFSLHATTHASATAKTIAVAAPPKKDTAAAPNVVANKDAAEANSADADDDGPPKVIRFANHPEVAPPFMINDLTGKPISTANFPGKVVILSFWATWCPPCREEIPELIELASRYKDQVEIVGISMDDDDAPGDMQKVQAFATKMGMNYPVAMANKDLVQEYGGVPALPTTFVLNKEGRVVQKHIGLISSAVYDTEIKSLLGMPVSVKVENFDDTGQIFLKNASLATELPGVDMSGLTEAQRKAALKRMNSESCTCGCGLTVAECRINDTSCDVSKDLAARIVADVSGKGKGKTPAPAPSPDEVIHH